MQLAKEMPNLDLVQGYLVPKDADPNATLEKQSEGVLPGVAYTSMKLAVKPVDPSCNNSASKTDASDDSKSGKHEEKKKKP